MNCDSPEIKIFSKMCHKTVPGMPISQFFPTNFINEKLHFSFGRKTVAPKMNVKIDSNRQ